MHCTRCTTPTSKKKNTIYKHNKKCASNNKHPPALSNRPSSVGTSVNGSSREMLCSLLLLRPGCHAAVLMWWWAGVSVSSSFGCRRVTQQEPNERTKRSLMLFTSRAEKPPWPAYATVLCRVRVETEWGGVRWNSSAGTPLSVSISFLSFLPFRTISSN